MASGLSAFISRIGAISGTLMIGYLIDDYCILVIVIVAAQLFRTYFNFQHSIFLISFRLISMYRIKQFDLSYWNSDSIAIMLVRPLISRLLKFTLFSTILYFNKYWYFYIYLLNNLCKIFLFIFAIKFYNIFNIIKY